MGLPPVGLLAALVGLGLALTGPRRCFGLFVATMAAGWWNAGLQAPQPEAVPFLRVSGPVEIVGPVEGPVRSRDGESLFYVRAERLRQGPRVSLVDECLRVTLPGVAPDSGSVVRLRGFLRPPSSFANLERSTQSGIWSLRLKSSRFLAVERPQGVFSRLAARWRSKIASALGSRSAGTALTRALILGDRGALPASWEPTLRRLGLAHVLAVSGLHVGLLAVLLLLAAAPLPRGARFALALAGVGLYLLLIGPRPAVLRAGAMGLLALGALSLQRPPQALNALSWGVVVLVGHDPRVISDLGFQLSVAATAGLVVLSPVLFDRWRALPAAWRRPLTASYAAQVSTWPFLVPLTGTLHPLALVYNLLALPWLACFLAAAFVWLAGTLIWPDLAESLLTVLDLLAVPLVVVAELPPTELDLFLLDTGPATALALSALFLAVGLWPRRTLRVLPWLALLLCTGAAPRRSRGDDPVELVALDVGQGDAVVLRDGDRAMLVDGGGWHRGDLGGRVLLPALAGLGVRRVEAVVLTHPDLDHCAGLRDLTRYLPLGEVRMGPGWTRSACAGELVSAPGTRWRVSWAGDVLRLGRWRLDVLQPGPGERHDDNDGSLVVMAEAAGRRVLLTGDLEAVAERRLVARWGDRLRADVLKVAHHGSKTSTHLNFLRTVRPRWALISAGRGNPYGHPSDSVLRRLESAGVRVLRTDLSGRLDVLIHDDGRMLVGPGR